MTLSMTCEQFEDILPDLLDADTAPVALTPAVRGHLAACAGCRLLFADLSNARSAAAALPPLVPSRDLWSGIASRIQTPIVPLVDGMEVRRPRRQISWRSAGIAAAVLVVANLVVGYALTRGGSTPMAALPDDTAGIPAPSIMRTSVRSEGMMVPLRVPVRMAPARRSTIVLAANDVQGAQGPGPTQQPTRRREAAKVVYDREIGRLLAIVDSGRHKLDPATVAILDRNLRVIDLAIEQCNEALARDSSSTFLIESLNNAYQTKVKLLRIAAAAASRG